jgi:hypothetical protein
MIDSNQVYIRFRGRTVGPIVKAKALDMAKRGQLTRSHEISFDGSTWSLAGDMDEFFPALAKVTKKSQTTDEILDSLEATTPNEQWYAHYDGDNQGPMDLLRMMALVDSGRIRAETMVWKPGTPSWVEAKVAFPNRFQPEVAVTTGAASDPSSQADTNLDGIATLARRPKPWIMFLGIVGVVWSSVVVLGLALVFVELVSSAESGPVKVLSVVWYMIHILIFAAFFYCFVILIKMSNSIGILNYRVTASDLEASLKVSHHFWKWIGITVAVLIAINTAAVLAFAALGVSIGSALRSGV